MSFGRKMHLDLSAVFARKHLQSQDVDSRMLGMNSKYRDSPHRGMVDIMEKHMRSNEGVRIDLDTVSDVSLKTKNFKKLM